MKGALYFYPRAPHIGRHMSKVITLTELKGYIDGDVDATRGATVVDAVNQAVETITGRVWGEIESGSESHDYASEIFLRNMDVITVTDVRQNGTSRAANSYHFNSNGRLSLSTTEAGFYPRWNEIEVTYTHGNPLVPADLKLAALSLASDFYSYAADGQKEVTAEGVGSLRYSYASGKNSATGSDHFATLDRYRMRGL